MLGTLVKVFSEFAKVFTKVSRKFIHIQLVKGYHSLPPWAPAGGGYRRISVWSRFSSQCGAVLRTFTFPFVGSRPSKAPHHCCFGSGGCAPKTKGTAAIQKTDAKTSKRTAQDHKEGHGEDVKENGSQDLERPRSMPDELP